MQHGWVLLHKPPGMSSFRALRPLKKAYNTKRIGHCGTLDPFADGLLLVAVGRVTRLLPETQKWHKRYTFKVAWGAFTSTDDLEGDVVETKEHRPTEKEIKAALPHFCGAIVQKPPAYSALKVNGRRAYDLARRGVAFELSPRMQHVYSFKMLSCERDFGTFDVLCNRGTYIRSLARDLATQLGTAGHLVALKRTAIGPFALQDSEGVDLFEKKRHNEEELAHLLRPPQALLDDIPAVEVDKAMALRLSEGQSVALGLEAERAFCLCDERCVAFVRAKDGYLWPRIVFIDYQERNKEDVDDS